MRYRLSAIFDSTRQSEGLASCKGKLTRPWPLALKEQTACAAIICVPNGSPDCAALKFRSCCARFRLAASFRLSPVLNGLNRASDDPFALTPGYSACFKHRSFAAAKRRLVESLQTTGSITTVTGAPGTGKTTLLNDVVSRLSPVQAAIGRVVTAQLRAPDMLRAVAFSFGLDGKRPQIGELLASLQHYWAKQLQLRRRVILVVDEAQALQACAGQMLGGLAAGNGAESKSVHLILAGDAPANMHSPVTPFQRLLALASTRCHLQPLSAAEIEGYVRHRLASRGGRQEPHITDQALTLVHHQTGGIPAGINLLCRRLLLRGSVERKNRLHTDEVHQVLGELQAEALLPMPSPDAPLRH